jgi:hypothetical protein
MAMEGRMASTKPYAILLAPNADGPAHAVLDLLGSMEVLDVAVALDAVFAAFEDYEQIDLVMDGDPVGRVSRDRLIAVTRAYGDADGATLPGLSFKYRAITFQCHACGVSVLRIHLDQRHPPMCPTGHGPLDRITPDE